MADHDNNSGFSGWGIFFLIIFILVILFSAGWVIFTQYRARRLGLPAPSLNPFARNRNRDRNAYTAPAPAPTGIKAWFTEKLSSLRGSNRSAGGAYESTGYGGPSGGRNDRRGFGPLDPDEAWDARVGNEYYEEQELGLQDPRDGPYGGTGYGNVVGAEVQGGAARGRSQQRELDERYDEEMELGIEDHGSRSGLKPTNPFGDDNELRSGSSMRGVSPRPILDTQHKSQASLASIDTRDSPSERRSMFRENM